jgi:hypothetical protein
LQASDDLQGIRLAVGHVAELHQIGVPAAPFPVCVDQAGGACDVRPRLVIAVEVADSDDPLRCRRANRCPKRQSAKQKRNATQDSLEHEASPLKLLHSPSVVAIRRGSSSVSTSSLWKVRSASVTARRSSIRHRYLSKA